MPFSSAGADAARSGLLSPASRCAGEGLSAASVRSTTAPSTAAAPCQQEAFAHAQQGLSKRCISCTQVRMLRMTSQAMYCHRTIGFLRSSVSCLAAYTPSSDPGIMTSRIDLERPNLDPKLN